MAPHSRTLAWKIPWTEEPGRLQSMGSLRVWHDWATSLSLFTFMHWRRKWQPIPVFLPGESQGQGRLVATIYGVTQSRTRLKRLSSSSREAWSMGYKGSNMTEQLNWTVNYLSIPLMNWNVSSALFSYMMHFCKTTGNLIVQKLNNIIIDSKEGKKYKIPNGLLLFQTLVWCGFLLF